MAKARSSNANSALLARLLSLSKPHILQAGHYPTSVPYLNFTRFDGPTAVGRGMLEPSFCVVLQGRKQIHLGRETVRYGVGEYLVATAELPASGQVIGASPTEPYLGLRILFEPREIAEVILEAKLSFPPLNITHPAAFVGRGDASVLEVIERLLRTLPKEDEARFLAASYKREILYRLLKSDLGPYFHQSVMLSHPDLGVGKAIGWLKKNFHRPLRVEELAKASDMSVSSLHHKFKAFTKMGPLQYQKQLRLQEARRLLVAEAGNVADIAYRVGYESQSQFTREYRRLFGSSPLQDKKGLQESQLATALQD